MATSFEYIIVHDVKSIFKADLKFIRNSLLNTSSNGSHDIYMNHRLSTQMTNFGIKISNVVPLKYAAS